ncbi:seminal fluid protein CSSFP037 [Danaus plexippus plexippus]|uniref:Seminal fluid protein CSSFP037 n=1 Tax=Danaus plexippus plexippus TaxID=278856 RepID=A0A212EYY4_DANPL|nr:seminal fluid protein CSSFP037 [Danaus plexippus plexippus]
MRPETVLIFMLGLSFVSSSPTSIEVNRIVNGVKADIKDVPYQAILQKRTNYGWSFTCGAAVISTRFVLTAAHCVRAYEREPEGIRVIVGSSMRNSGGTALDVLKVIPHHSYSPLTLINDIAMIKTKTSMNFGVSLKAVDIPTPDFHLPDGSNVLVSGYGLMNYGGLPSSSLRAAYVNVVSQGLCRIAYRDIIVITDGMLCACADNPPRDACQGDSGGPLVYENTIVGIVSFGEGCANRTYPGVYTRVSEYYAWINENLLEVN